MNRSPQFDVSFYAENASETPNISTLINNEWHNPKKSKHGDFPSVGTQTGSQAHAESPYRFPHNTHINIE